jgi:AbrB family looped-hinge helix DNA binding protein
VSFLLFEYKATIVLGDRGRLVIPDQVRKALELNQGDKLIIEVQDGIITICPTYEGGEK